MNAPSRPLKTSGENKSYASHPDEDCYIVAGTQGSLSGPTFRLKTYAGERSWWQPFVDTAAHESAGSPA